MSMVMPLVLASLFFGGCGNETKRTAAEPVPRTDQRGTVPNNSASPDRHKKPPVRQLEEHPDRTKAVRDDQNENKQQTAPQRSETNSPTGQPMAEQKQHDKQTAGLPRSHSERDARKQAESLTPLDQSEREADVAVTQRIRQALLREDLSFTAQNVLVITEADHVVLKGQVRSQAEAERIKGIAATMTTKRIEDVLEVTP
jgi:hypothetical protein